MKAHQVMFGITVICGIIWFVQVGNLSEINAEGEALSARIEEFNNLGSGKNISRLVKSAFDGFTFGMFAQEGIFTEANKIEREADQLNSAVYSLQARYKKAVFYRNASLVVGIITLIIGIISLKSQKEELANV